MHPNQETAVGTERAAWLASELLAARGVKDIEVFDVLWIAAPLTGYLINATGVLQMGDARFLAFRVGLRDGQEEEGNECTAGEEFAFIALGYDEEGRQVWHPAPGPDFRPGKEESYPCELLVYEFLSPEDRERLESLLREASAPAD